MHHPIAHTLKKFDEELATLRDRVLQMGGLAEEQVRRAVQALEQGDPQTAREVIGRDRELDVIELEIDEGIAHVLALRAPLGVDLRTVLTLGKTVTDLERIGDEARKVARSAEALHEETGDAPGLPFLPDLPLLAQQALGMLRSALDALVRRDLERARGLGAMDDRLDRDFAAITVRIRDFMADQPELIGPCLHVLFAAKALERIGDHAKNIGDYVFYLVEGRDIRHPEVNPAFSG
ncbi:MAG: phosphate signaling complex protein PhoU [Lysobacteraceae bacterium]